MYQEETFDCRLRLKKFNDASPLPGTPGGVRNGAGAQEETIFRRTNLFK